MCSILLATNISTQVSSNSEASASELLETYVDMFPRYCMQCDVFSRFKSSTIQQSANRCEKNKNNGLVLLSQEALIFVYRGPYVCALVRPLYMCLGALIYVFRGPYICVQGPLYLCLGALIFVFQCPYICTQEGLIYVFRGSYICVWGFIFVSLSTPYS